MTEYIKRNKVVDVLTGVENDCQKYKPFNGNEGKIYRALIKAEMTIGKLPAADVVPVVTGRWNDIGYKLQCSLCNHTVFLGTKCMCVHDEEKRLFKYCPHCGAKMVG